MCKTQVTNNYSEINRKDQKNRIYCLDDSRNKGEQQKMVSIYACQIHNIKMTKEAIRERLSPERLDQVGRFRPDDTLRSLAGDLLVLHALRENGYNLTHLPSYAITKQGKPSLPDYPDFQFNVSHSGKWAVCAISCQPVGIDIQQERTIKPALITRTLTKRETEYLNSQPASIRQTVFFDYWCLKEAYLKATGTGLTVPLQSIEIDLENTTLSDAAYQIQLPAFPEIHYHIGLCCQEHLSGPVVIKNLG